MPTMTITNLLFSHRRAMGELWWRRRCPGCRRAPPAPPALLRRRRLRRLQILGVPSQVTLDAVPLVTGPRDAVVLTGIDHQLGGHAQAAQRLVHLLAAHQRHIEVALSAQEERGRRDLVGVQERIGDPDPRIEADLPGRADLFVVLHYVLVHAIERERAGRAGAAGGGLETMV